MPLFAQIPGVDDAIKQASGRGWEAVFLVVVIAAFLGAFWFLLRQIMNEAKAREERLSTRVSYLEDLIQNKLMDALNENSKILGQVMEAASAIIRAADRMSETLSKFTHILDVRPCLLPNAEQRRLLAEFDEAQEPSSACRK